MTWPFENDTSAITKKLAKKSLQSEKRRNLMVVIAVALAAFLICFTGIVSTSLTQMQRNQVLDTYEAVWLGVEENDIETLKGVPEFERVGGYYMLGEELSEQGYHASYVYNDAEMMEIGRDQMKLLEGNLPQKANEVVVSKYFLSTYGHNAKIGDTVTLDTESFHGDYVVTGIHIDPFANNSRLASVTNDLDPQFDTDYHMDALEFLKMFADGSVDTVLYDPPFSPRQVSECYKKLGQTVNMKTTQASYWSRQKEQIGRIVKKGGIVITCSWNSGGIGKKHGFEMEEILLVAHGGWHNDTIVVVERKIK